MNSLLAILKTYWAEFAGLALPLQIPTYVLAFFLLLSILLAFVKRLGLRREQARKLDTIYALLLKKLDIQQAESELLDEISRFQSNREDKSLLLLDPHEFETCVRKLKHAKEVSEPVLDDLRKKTHHLVEKPDNSYSISAELPVGTRVILISGDKTRMAGHLSSQETRFFVVSLDRSSASPNAGDPLRVYIYDRTGVFSFPSTVAKTSDGDVCLEHSDKFRRFQRRQYYRKEAPIPVLVKAAYTEQTYLSSELVDVGGGGAALKNPEKQFKVNDSVLITFSVSDEKFSVVAKVVRISQNSEILHISFVSINEANRERLMSTLY
jgi:hypothetical protein